MAPSDSMTERAGPTRSVAPTIAIERGLTSGSSCMYSPLGGPLSKEQRDQNAEQHRAREQRRHHGDDGIGFEADRFEHLFRQRRCVAAGDEDRDHRLVEGMQEGE